MKTKTFTLMIASVLALVFLLGLGSAKVVYLDVNTGAEITTLSFTANHNSQATAQFKIKNQDNDVTAINITPLDNNFTLSGVPDSLAAGATSDAITLTVNVPQYKSGIYSTSLEGNGTMTNTIYFDLNVDVTINDSYSLSVSDASIPAGENSTTITIKNTGNTILNNINLSASGDFETTLSTNTISSLNPGSTATITLTVNEDIEDLIDSNSVKVTASTENATDEGTVTLEADYCEIADDGNLKIEIDDVSVESGFGDDDEWLPLDEVKIEINVENEGDEDIDDIVLEWGLYNTKTKKWYIDDEENDFNLKDGDDKDIEITFRLDEDIDELEDGNFVFYVRATGEDDEFDGNETCVSDSKEINIVIENDFVILDDIKIPETVACGTTAQITADVWNIGDEDQEDLYVKIYSKELDILEEIDFESIDAFEKEDLSVEFNVPSDIEEGTYSIKFTVYDEDGDIYENDFDDEESVYTLALKVEGACTGGVADATISADIESGGKAGQELVVKSTIINTGLSTQTYTIQLTGYDKWATLESQDKTTIVLGAGNSEEVAFTFNVDEDVEGSQSFEITLVSSDGSTITQPMTITIEEAEKGFLAGITGNVISGDNWYLWGIGALNLILIIVIIVVVVRIIRK